MTTLDDIAEAFEAIGRARAHYRDTLKAGLAAGVPQVDISDRLDRTRETLRRDAMNEEELAAHRAADRRRRRGAAA